MPEPVAATVKPAVLPTVTLALLGWVVMLGAVPAALTVSATSLDSTVPPDQSTASRTRSVLFQLPPVTLVAPVVRVVDVAPLTSAHAPAPAACRCQRRPVKVPPTDAVKVAAVGAVTVCAVGCASMVGAVPPAVPCTTHFTPA